MSPSQSCAAIVNSTKERREAILAKTIVYAPNDCILWTGCLNNKGYGMSGIERRTVQCHRVAFFHANGYLTDGLVVMHKCDTPSCVNPEHLIEGTHADNAKDRDIKGRNRQQSGDRNGARTKPWTLKRGDQHHTRTRPETVKRGEENANSILTKSVVLEMRTEWANRSIASMSRHFGISESQAGRIRYNESWVDSDYTPPIR